MEFPWFHWVSFAWYGVLRSQWIIHGSTKTENGCLSVIDYRGSCRSLLYEKSFIASCYACLSVQYPSREQVNCWNTVKWLTSFFLEVCLFFSRLQVVSDDPWVFHTFGKNTKEGYSINCYGSSGTKPWCKFGWKSQSTWLSHLQTRGICLVWRCHRCAAQKRHHRGGRKKNVVKKTLGKSSKDHLRICCSGRQPALLTMS